MSVEGDLRTQVRTLQIIVLALAMGVAAFGAYAVLNPAQEAHGNAVIPQLAIAMAVGGAAMSVIVGQVLTRVQCQAIAAGSYDPGQVPVAASDEGKLLMVYQTRIIVECAILEGAAFFNLFAYLTEKTVYSLAVAVILLVGIIVHFPRVSSTRAWLDLRLRDIRDARNAGS